MGITHVSHQTYKYLKKGLRLYSDVCQMHFDPQVYERKQQQKNRQFKKIVD